MNVMGRPLWSWLLTIGLAALLAVMAVLQYRWIDLRSGTPFRVPQIAGRGSPWLCWTSNR
jgi:hypothetical protein